MTIHQGPTPPELLPAQRVGVLGRLRRYFLTGIVVTAPLAITVYIAWTAITWIDEKVASLVPPHFRPDAYLPVHVPGIGLVVTLVAFTLIGWLAAGLAGRSLVRLGEAVVARMPVVRGIYSALKQVFETLFTKSANSFRQVVLVEYPRRGAWTVAFITGKAQGEVEQRLANGGGELTAIYVPTTPNPTSGFLLYVPANELILLDMSVEEGLKLVISVGLVTPSARPAA